MMDIGVANLALAASVCDRTHDLIEAGWVKGRFYGGYENVQTFCILGAIDLALEELLDQNQMYAREDIKHVATTFILDEALAQYKYSKGGSIPGFNDAAEREHDQVLSVLSGAAKRLWNLSVDDQELGQIWQPSQWAEVDQATAQEYQKVYLESVLA